MAPLSYRQEHGFNRCSILDSLEAALQYGSNRKFHHQRGR
jgi:hypothetical protein